MTDKHEALIFADDRRTSSGDDLYEWAIDAEDWIRRLRAELETLRAKLRTYEDLGGAADDVQLLRMGYAAARLEIESLKAQLAERASHGQAPAAVAGPVVNRATVIEWLDANDIEVTDRQMDGLFHSAAPTTQPLPASQGDALSDDAVRVPLDSLHADAAYLIGRLRDGSMPYARAIEIIRERIDAAKAAIRARAAQGDALDAARYRFLRDGEWRDTDLEPFIRLQLNALWDAKIDAASAAQEDKKP